MPRVRAKKVKSESAIADFARNSTRNMGGVRCFTCQNLAWRNQIREAMVVWASGEGEPCYAALWEWLNSNTDYDVSQPAMWNHCRRHETVLFQEIQARVRGIK